MSKKDKDQKPVTDIGPGPDGADYRRMAAETTDEQLREKFLCLAEIMEGTR